MGVIGTIYGVVLNDREERAALADRFGDKPYGAPPVAPVMYVKPRQTVTDGPIRIGADVPELRVAATLALLFGRDAADVGADDGWAAVAATALAIDAFVPHPDYYRPALPQRTRVASLAFGRFAAPVRPDAIETLVDDVPVHGWSLDRLFRPAGQLVSDLSRFMTLRAGDVLLVGLAGDAPLIRAGQSVEVRGANLPALRTHVEGSES